MLRSHHCGALNEKHSNEDVTLAGWVQKVRNKGFIVWVDIRDRYGITQLIFDEERSPKAVFKKSLELGREDVIQIKGKVIERESKNPKMSTGAIEILVGELTV
ncbi:OB-fold nucleic acid binding domain-containing protein, partial [Flavobacteriaceae bacterium]|nr:OB-fold nucleic acid binding domain-containing protein [Flavobacteriaceae bacterium]